jgi:hypothetical protein
VVNYYKRNFELISTWYGDIPELVLPMDFFVTDGFPFIGAIAASFQPYVEGTKFDLFDDFSDDELLTLFSASNFLQRQFVLFANKTIELWSERQMCYDFLGNGNILLANQNGMYKLNIVDIGIFNFDLAVNNTPEKLARIEKRIERLSSLLNRA